MENSSSKMVFPRKEIYQAVGLKSLHMISLIAKSMSVALINIEYILELSN